MGLALLLLLFILILAFSLIGNPVGYKTLGTLYHLANLEYDASPISYSLRIFNLIKRNRHFLFKLFEFTPFASNS